MITVSIREAKNKLTELARRVEAGERIIVTRHGKPVLEMVQPTRKGGLNLEAGEAYLRSKGIEPRESWISPDFDDPLPEDFLLQPLPESPPRKLG
jgi:antitoxin (DNA-binding transcriptional repressor) of toxin-antitoxin stability system